MFCVLSSHPLTGLPQPKDIFGGLKPFEDTEVLLHHSNASRYEVCEKMFLLFPSQGGFQNEINSIVVQFC